MNVALDLLLHTVDHPWESLRMVLKKHADDDLGDPLEKGTAAWHLRHIAETFRLHADHASGNAIEWPALPNDLAELLDTIKADIETFITWAKECPSDDLVKRRIEYHHSMDLGEMIGIMGRHIVWHAAAIHYWLLWKRPSRPSA